MSRVLSTTKRCAFDLPFALVGRDPCSDLRLDSLEVSERHAYFQIVSGQLFCIDLGSRIGVYYGGRCRRSSHVERDQVVRIGPYRLRLLAGDPFTMLSTRNLTRNPRRFWNSHTDCCGNHVRCCRKVFRSSAVPRIAGFG